MKPRTHGSKVVLIACLFAACTTPPRREPVAPDGNHIVNLYDAFGPSIEGLTKDFGFSALVRYNGMTILFDAGTNADLFAANVEALGIDLREVDLAVASHAHFDHINGFDHLLEVNPDVTLYFPADLYWGMNVEFSVEGPEPGAAAALPEEQRYFDGEKEQFLFRQTGRFRGARVEYVGQDTEIAPGVTLIATRSNQLGYFTRYATLGGLEGGAVEEGDAKTIGLPELSLNLEVEGGDVLLVGCSHSQVETIVRETSDALQHPIGLVYGGYHMLPYTSPEIRSVAVRLRDDLGVQAVAPAHCTGHAAFSVFREVFEDRYHLAGLGTVIEF